MVMFSLQMGEVGTEKGRIRLQQELVRANIKYCLASRAHGVWMWALKSFRISASTILLTVAHMTFPLGWLYAWPAASLSRHSWPLAGSPLQPWLHSPRITLGPFRGCKNCNPAHTIWPPRILEATLTPSLHCACVQKQHHQDTAEVCHWLEQ